MFYEYGKYQIFQLFKGSNNGHEQNKRELNFFPSCARTFYSMNFIIYMFVYYLVAFLFQSRPNKLADRLTNYLLIAHYYIV
jgi:hypothetical protein